MKRKLIFLVVGVVLILAAIIGIAGRGGLHGQRRQMNDEFVATPDGKLVVKPGERSKSTFVVGEDFANQKTNTPSPPR
jgi:hypothetical protein